MGKSLAFYAPMKPPNHPVPSGDRTIARAIQAALQQIDWVDEVVLVSTLRTRDGVGDADVQARLTGEAAEEVDRILSSQRFDGWVTYHNYYKAPDLIGPAVSRAAGLPYFVVEASKSPKRAKGPWAGFARLADSATDAADAVFYFTNRDLPALEQSRPAAQRLIHLPPFLNRQSLPDAQDGQSNYRLIAVGMFRAGDKLASYTTLAAALRELRFADWSLTIVGDGPCADQVRALFAPFGAQVTFAGEQTPDAVLQSLAASDLLVWPGVNEAFGMIYLEAQSVGLSVVAEDRPGVRDVVSPHGVLAPRDDPAAFARAVEQALVAGPQTDAARRFVADRHLRPAACKILDAGMAPFLGELT